VRKLGPSGSDPVPGCAPDAPDAPPPAPVRRSPAPGAIHASMEFAREKENGKIVGDGRDLAEARWTRN
jgi:hypothetical protein